ncbi:hypothetical protein LCGC14_3022590 [marine sediment metagenome]|uniref:Uncharacterized protein n=1 Tax=marine sediment metagenome TaxID=412755 RepID=A0A0F8WUR5_9ZZZZ
MTKHTTANSQQAEIDTSNAGSTINFKPNQLPPQLPEKVEKELRRSFSVSAMSGYAGKEDWIESLIFFVAQAQTDLLESLSKEVEVRRKNYIGGRKNIVDPFLLRTIKIYDDVLKLIKGKL